MIAGIHNPRARSKTLASIAANIAMVGNGAPNKIHMVLDVLSSTWKSPLSRALPASPRRSALHDRFSVDAGQRAIIMRAPRLDT
jgi:hypothetical protein